MRVVRRIASPRSPRCCTRRTASKKGLMTHGPLLHQRPERPRPAAQRSLSSTFGGTKHSFPQAPAPRRRWGWRFQNFRVALTGIAFRVPTPTGSVVDLTALAGQGRHPRKRSNAAMKKAADGPLKDILYYTEDPIVSSDIIGDPPQFDLRRRLHPGDAGQSAEGRQLVRQRMGLQQPHGRLDRATRQALVCPCITAENTPAQGLTRSGFFVRANTLQRDSNEGNDAPV